MSESTQNSVYRILAFVFPGEESAGNVSEELKLGAEDGDYKIVANAVVAVDVNGKPHVHEPGHGSAGTAIGAAAGGLLGLIGGPVGLLFWAAAGGVVGGVAGKHTGQAIPPEDLKELAGEMDPDTSAILAMVDDEDADDVVSEMKGYTTNVVTLTVGDATSGEIAQAVAAQTTAKATAKA
jgi:uncharacterized membrane protein